MKSLNFWIRTSVLVFLFLAGAKILNFLKKIMIGKLFGVSVVADAFFAATFLPYYLSVFFDSIFFLVFLPLFSQILQQKGKEEGVKFVQDGFSLVLMLAGVGTLIAWFGAPWIVKELVPGFKSDQIDLTVHLFRIFSTSLIFMAMRSVFQALNSYFQHYAIAASTGFVDSLVMLAVTLASYKAWGIAGAAWGAVLGILISFAFQAAGILRRSEFFPKKLSLNFNTWSLLVRVFIPMGAVWTFQQVPILILNRFGSGMWEGTVSAMNISQTLSTVPMALLSQTILFAIFPSMIKQAGKTDSTRMRETFLNTLKGAFLILIPAGFLLSALARPAAVLFFDGGGITFEGTRRIANTLACFGWASFALYADLFMSQSLIALRKAVPVLGFYLIRAVLTYVLGYFLTIAWDYKGLALSFSLALVINFFVFLPLLLRSSPLSGAWRPFFSYTGRVILASMPALGVGWFLNRWSLRTWESFSMVARMGWPAAAAVFFLLCYGFLLFGLRVQEFRLLMGGFRTWMEEKMQRIKLKKTVAE